MNIPHSAFSVFLILYACHVIASIPSSAVLATGATRLNGIVAGHRIFLNIWTHKVDIGKMGVERPDVAHNSCTYSRVPCSVVEALELTVDGNRIFMPRSAFCDLSDLATVGIDVVNGRLTVIASGGDASEAYDVKIEFDTERVTKRVVASGMDATNPTEITNYYETSSID